MAVLDAHPGLRTEITVNKKSLTEYHNDNVDTSPTAVNKFIKARTGAEVKTILKNPLPRDNGVEITCSVDGHQAARWDIDPENPTWYAPTNMKGIITVGEESILQKFQFSKLAIGDPGRIGKKLLKKLSSSGTIKIVLQGLHNIRTGATVKPQRTTEQSEIGVVPEKAVKAALQALGVIPREPTLTPLEERPADELNAEELRELVKRLRERETALTHIKVE
ncbi:hypothetical protein N0V91_004840 [Didymella pomorum]|uniref:DUF7918 domain-containing protein n=1 Tax=Didymella pomorum TaxID=749634 RepID=A0A9W8ZDU1_9PLEO|nr:hypothetical protein N0V91_004840 [Didymella pomorum]